MKREENDSNSCPRGARLSDVLTQSRRLLCEGGIESAGLDAALLISAALGKSRAYLYAHPEYVLSANEYERCNQFLERRLLGECTAYITGRKEFRFLDLTVDGRVLVPRADTETLVEAALQSLPPAPAPAPARRISALDLCTGSGAVALALKYERPFLDVSASDISEDALGIARENAARYHLEARIIQSNLFEHITGRYTLITANAPYIPSAMIDTLAPETRREPRLALDGGADGLFFIRAIIAGAPEYLEEGGTLLLEAFPALMPEIRGLLQTAGYTKIRIYNDMAGNPRVIGGIIRGLLAE